MNLPAEIGPERTGRLYRPRPAEVTADARGTPIQVNGSDVVAIREEWIVEDGWWTAAPIRRWYFELILIDGRDLTLFRAFPSAQWFSQRA
ncbi:MAG: hypothetical protein M9938_10510 [Solirubrobacterales bacterium]|nr:hypothetical protein [Solirubrobacterales bacterium]